MKFLKNGNDFINLSNAGTISFSDKNFSVIISINSDDVTEIKFVTGKYEEVKLLITDFLFNSIQFLDLTNLVRVEGQEIVIDKERLDYRFVDIAKTLVILQNASVSLISRKFNLDYQSADRIMETLVEAKIIGNIRDDGSRNILFSNEIDLLSHLKALDLVE